MLNLDTHIVLFMAAGQLTPAEKACVRSTRLGISAIVLWEITKLYQRGRISLSLQHPGLAEFVAALHVWNITPEVCHATLSLDFGSDPADELIAATSVAHNVPLLTRDAKVLRSQVVPFALR